VEVGLGVIHRLLVLLVLLVLMLLVDECVLMS